MRAREVDSEGGGRELECVWARRRMSREGDSEGGGEGEDRKVGGGRAREGGGEKALQPCNPITTWSGT